MFLKLLFLKLKPGPNLFPGGTLGVFCGASFLSFIEILVWLLKFFSASAAAKRVNETRPPRIAH